jgi:predicted GIY-YIG superfamily endonuclease
MIGVYNIINTKTGKRYIGSSVEIEARWKCHKKSLIDNKHYNDKLQRAWNKYGADSFLWVVYQYCDDGEKALDLEQSLLNAFNFTGNWKKLYNISKDARSATRGRELSNEHKQKISEANRGKKRSEKVRLKLSESAKKKKHPGFSEETKRKMSEAAKNRPPISEESRIKRSEAQKAKKLSEETKQKISEANKGRKKPPRSEEHQRKIVESKKRNKHYRDACIPESNILGE